MALHKSFVIMTSGPEQQPPQMRLWEKAKIFGIWNPSVLDLSYNDTNWQTFTNKEKTYTYPDKEGNIIHEK